MSFQDKRGVECSADDPRGHCQEALATALEPFAKPGVRFRACTGGDLHVPDHSIEFLRQKSEQRRAELKETISQLSQTLSDTSDEIKTTFSPRHLTQEARAYAKERGEQ